MPLVMVFMELQVLLTVFLVVQFRFLQDRLPHRGFTRLWTWAWLWLGVHLSFGWRSLYLGPELTIAKGAAGLISVAAGYVQIPFVLLGAFSLRRKIPRRWQRAAGLAFALVGAGVYSLSLAIVPDLFASYAIRSIPRLVLLAMAFLLGCVVLLRWRREHRSQGALVTAVSCLVGGLLHLLNALRNAAPYLGTASQPVMSLLRAVGLSDTRWFYLDIAWQCGIALGMILFLLDDYSRTQAAHRQSERKFYKAFHSSPDILVISEAATSRLIEVNDSFVRVTGHPRSQVIGRLAAELHLWDDPADRRRLLEMLQTAGRARDFESRFRTSSGELRVGLVSAEIIELDGRDCTLHVIHDITARQRTDDALRSIAQGTAAVASRDFFASLVQHLASALQVRYAFVTECTDTTRARLRTLAFWNGDALANNVEYNVAGGPCASVVLGETSQYPWNLCDLFPEDVALRKLSAESYVGIPLMSSSGSVIGHLAVMHDQAMEASSVNMQILQIFAARAGVELERDRMLQALQASEERYRDLVENANDIIYTTNLEGRFTSLNLRGEQICGYSRSEILQMGLQNIVAPESTQRAEGLIARAPQGAEKPMELEIVSRDGRRVWLEISSRPVCMDGEPVGVEGIARDVTDRKRLEDQLRQAQKMEAVGQLAGGIAHDFNNLLMVISGYCDLLHERLDDDHPGRRHTEQILKAAQRASGLTKQLLAFSRKQVLQPRILDLNHLMLELGKMLPRVIREDIELRIVPGGNLGRVKTDPNQIDQVIMNLVVNARDAMPRGGKLTIETDNVSFDEDTSPRHAGMPSGDYVMLAVSDTGMGMDAATQRRIFEPFFTTKEQGKGTGLGLATVYGIVKQSGGFIWVYSEPGRGTSFKIYLPRAASPAEAPSEELEAPVFRGTETVLLVEDEDSVRSLTREFLERAGYTVLEAREPFEALALGAKHADELHLLITDVIMPGLSGPELAERIKLCQPEIRVLYVSGYADEAMVSHRLLEHGAAFVEKPFDRSTLASRVRDLLDGPRPAAAHAH